MLIQSAELLLAGIALYAGVLGLYIASRRVGEHVFLAFGLTSLAAAGYALSMAWGYATEDVITMARALRAQISCALIFLIALVWFAAFYSRARITRLLLASLLAITGLALLLLGLNFASPVSLLYADLTGIQRHVLPWGETISLAEGTTGRLFLPYQATSFAGLGIAVGLAIGMIRKKVSSEGVLMAVGCGSLLAAAVHGTLIDLGWIRSVYLAEFAFILLIVLMGMSLASTIIDAARIQEALAKSEAKLRVAQEQAHHAQKMEAVGQLAAGIAHDYNNILMVIQGHGEILRHKLDRASELRDSADDILRAADRGAELSRKLLTFSRTQPHSVRPTDLHAVVREVVALLQHGVGSSIELRCALEASCSVAVCDPGEMQSALLNLGINARDAMPDGGVLGFWSENVELGEAECQQSAFGLRPGLHVRLSVEDNGTGIPADDLERIFEPFFTTKPEEKGTGLGLAVVYGSITEAGGSIEVSSTPGAGTRFDLLIPATTSADSVG